MFRYSWDLLQDVKTSTDLELCFNGICASYRRLAPDVRFMALLREEEVFSRSSGCFAGVSGSKASAGSLQSFA